MKRGAAHTWMLSEVFIDYSSAEILSFCTLQMSIPCSQTRNSTEFMRQGVESQAHSWSQVQVIPRDSSWRTEAKVLQQGAEEDEELHLSQTLSQTYPATCERQQRKKKGVICKRRECWKEELNSPTCRKRHEGISLDKLSIFAQKVRRIKFEWLLPLSLIVEDGGQQRVDRGPLERDTVRSLSPSHRFYSCRGWPTLTFSIKNPWKVMSWLVL